MHGGRGRDQDQFGAEIWPWLDPLHQHGRSFAPGFPELEEIAGFRRKALGQGGRKGDRVVIPLQSYERQNLT